MSAKKGHEKGNSFSQCLVADRDNQADQQLRRTAFPPALPLGKPGVVCPCTGPRDALLPNICVAWQQCPSQKRANWSEASLLRRELVTLCLTGTDTRLRKPPVCLTSAGPALLRKSVRTVAVLAASVHEPKAVSYGPKDTLWGVPSWPPPSLLP